MATKTTLALIAGLTMAAPAATALADAGRPVAVEVSHAKAPVRAQTQEVNSYAQREQDSTKAQSFQGGQTVIVFSGAALVALILLLLLI